MRSKSVILILALLIMWMFALCSQDLRASSILEFSDDFTIDSGMWEYLGSAYRDSTNHYIVLTEPVNNIAGVAFFNETSTSHFTANFSYKVGGGSGADGFVFFFYKQEYSSIGIGGGLGFNYEEVVPGYGIEFDNWRNIAGGEPSPPLEHGDPSANHIALIKDHVGNHLIYVDDPRTEDNLWHDVFVTVGNSSVEVLVDEDFVFHWDGPLNRTFDRFGFCAGTGSATNWHIIDNFSIEIHPSTPPTLTGTLDIKPNSLNLRSRGKWATAYIELPEGYDVVDINVSSILLNGTISAEMHPIGIGDEDGDGIPDLMVKFDRSEVISYILVNVDIEDKFTTITLTITGTLNDRTPFEGSDTIKILRSKGGPGKNCLLK